MSSIGKSLRSVVQSSLRYVLVPVSQCGGGDGQEAAENPATLRDKTMMIIPRYMSNCLTHNSLLLKPVSCLLKVNCQIFERGL